MAERLSKKDMDFALEIIQGEVFSCRDLCNTVKEKSVDYDRSVNSLWMVCLRLHIIVHKDLPLNMRDNEEWFYIPETLAEYADELGYNVDKCVRVARKRSKERPVTINKKTALNIMWSYYKNNKSWLPKSLSKKRSSILEQIMNGIPVEKVFEDHL